MKTLNANILRAGVLVKALSPQAIAPRFEIRRLQTAAELLAAAKLRYEIYIEEMGRAQKYADHQARTVFEPIDEAAEIYGIYSDAKIVGTFRINLSATTCFEKYPLLMDMYDLRGTLAHYPTSTMVISKLMIQSEYRGSKFFLRTSQFILERARKGGIQVGFIDTSPNLYKTYVRLGFREYKEDFDHPEYGMVKPLVFVANDQEHLLKVSSPLISMNQ